MTVNQNRRSVMVLYSDEMDINSHRVRLVLAEKGVTVDIIHVHPHDKPEDLLDINPYNTVPTLVDRELVLYQPRVIMEYLDERFPHPPLMPVYPVARAKSRLLIYRIENDWYSLIEKLEQGSGKEAEQARQDLLSSIVSISPVFGDKRFFLSDEYSLVDCCLAPLLWRFPHWGIEIPARAKEVIEYTKRVFDRDAFQASLTESESECEMTEEVF